MKHLKNLFLALWALLLAVATIVIYAYPLYLWVWVVMFDHPLEDKQLVCFLWCIWLVSIGNFAKVNFTSKLHALKIDNN